MGKIILLIVLMMFLIHSPPISSKTSVNVPAKQSTLIVNHQVVNLDNNIGFAELINPYLSGVFNISLNLSTGKEMPSTFSLMPTVEGLDISDFNFLGNSSETTTTLQSIVLPTMEGLDKREKV